MQYVIGIDGGGTKTLLKIADLEGNLISSCEGGPSNINSMDRQAVEQVLHGLINEAAGKTNGGSCRAVCLGAAGAGRAADKRILEEILLGTACSREIYVTDDAVPALYGGVGGNAGVIVIAGTGSICYGRNCSGESHRTGGWGHIIGDEGSGYYIGREILSHIMRSHDGREGKTLLTDMALRHLGLEKTEDLIRFVYRSNAGKKEIAGLARLADEACLQGDRTADNILKAAAGELFICADTVITKLGFDRTGTKLAVSGSILTKSRYVYDEFSRLLYEPYPHINVMKAQADAAWGCVLIALEKIRSAGV